MAPSQELVNSRFASWTQAMELSHAMLIAGLQRKYPELDPQIAFRNWYTEHQNRKWREIESAQKHNSDRDQRNANHGA